MKPVNRSPQIANPTLISSFGDIQNYLIVLVQNIITELRDHALNLNNQQINEFAKAALPSAADYKGRFIIVTDDVGGYTPAFSDGTNFRRTADRNIIS